jgi:hypothetical protein
MAKFAVSDRVHLPFRQARGELSSGTVTRSEPGRFRVTWDDPGRPARASRLRTWHLTSEATRFRLGNPGAEPE